MQTEETIIQPAQHGPMAIEVARKYYHEWKGIVTFDEDLAHYLEHGFVVSRPDVFAMGKVIIRGGEPAWFIRVAVGNLGALLRLLPVALPKICFCRRGVRLKVYSLERLLHHGRVAIG
jgi:hypothetical protein